MIIIEPCLTNVRVCAILHPQMTRKMETPTPALHLSMRAALSRNLCLECPHYRGGYAANSQTSTAR